MARVNPVRFSTKYQDEETDLLYYGYRYYNASPGRWLSKDPINEKGGKNLYVMVANTPVNAVDLLGLQGCCGPDVTVAVNNTLRSIENLFNANPTQQRSLCESLYDGRANGSWDITALKLAGMYDASPFSGRPNMGTGECRRTVVYNDKCVFAGSLNYIAFGKMNALCNKKFGNDSFSGAFGYPVSWTLWDAVVAVTYRKNWQVGDFGCTAAQAFDYTAVGYVGNLEDVPWWARGIPLTGGCPSCDTSGSRPISEQALPGVWNGKRF